MTAHNIPIWKFIIILNKMMDEGFNIMDITISDEMEIMLKGIREIDEGKESENKNKENDQKDFDWEETI